MNQATNRDTTSAAIDEDVVFTSHHHTHHRFASSRQHPLAPKTNYRNISVSYRLNKAIHIITITRPEVKNAVDRRTADELFQAFYDFEKDPNGCVAILYGGEDVFCAGADLKAISQGNMNLVEPPVETLKGPMGPTRMELSKPTIAAIGGGPCVAGGLELACWCDLRVCKSNTKWGVLCRRFGVPLIDGGSIRLPALIGLSRAMDLILTGREFTGEEAFRMGLANRLISPESNVLDAAVELATQLCKYPQLCLRHDRMSTYENAFSGKTLKEKLHTEYEHGLSPLNIETLKGAKTFLTTNVQRKSNL